MDFYERKIKTAANERWCVSLWHDADPSAARAAAIRLGLLVLIPALALAVLVESQPPAADMHLRKHCCKKSYGWGARALSQQGDGRIAYSQERFNFNPLTGAMVRLRIFCG